MSHPSPERPADRPVTRWGIVATGKIAHSFARDLRVVPGAELAAVASRTPENARAFAAEFGPTARLYGDAAALAADPDVDVVYIASPHTLHREQTLTVLAAGKPVLCEKPLTMNLAEAEELCAAADGLFLMEAMWMACNPVIRAVREQLLAGRFGTPRQVHADLGFRVGESASQRLTDPALGAGALLDMGIYPLTFAELMLGPVARAVAIAELRDGVDWDIAISTGHDGGGLAALTASMTSHSPRTATLATSDGLVEFPQPFHHPDHAVWHPAGGRPERIEGLEPLLGSGLGNEAAHVQQCLADGLTESPLVPKSQTLRLMSLMDQIRDQVGVRYAADQ
jgi:predicted dehydrogenase